MALPGYGNHGDHGRDGNLSVHGGNRLVGRWWIGSGTVFHARSRRRACATGNARGTNGRTLRAGDVQRQIVRLAAAGDAIPHDAKAKTVRAQSALGFFAPSKKSLA